MAHRPDEDPIIDVVMKIIAIASVVFMMLAMWRCSGPEIHNQQSEEIDAQSGKI